MTIPSPHKVMLVGAGPGSADLLTVRALRAIESAEALLYDALVSDEVLALAPRRCLKILTGKRSGRVSMRQAEINALMLKLARRGFKVVRLKGGDPSVFGRVGEEREHLETHGVAVEVVPGVTAASAAAAQFAFPLTHRGEARRLILMTARLRDGRLSDADWAAAAADREATLAVYMGRDAIGRIAEQLIALGRDARLPAVAIENAGSASARLHASVLGDIGQVVDAAAQSGPVVLIIGEVAGRARTAPSIASPAPDWLATA